MKITEKIIFPYQDEINHLGEIQAQQVDYFDLPIAKQYQFFVSEYDAVLDYYEKNDLQYLIQKKELTDLLFNVHAVSYQLPKSFIQTLSLLKITALKCGLQYSAFFSYPDNPLTQYLHTVCQYINTKMTQKNQALCLKLLSSSVNQIINEFQFDPSFFEMHSEKFVTSFKQISSLNKGAKKAKQKKIPANVTHIKSETAAFSPLTTNLKKGDWLDFNQGKNKTFIKLIWKADDNNDYVFVDRNGAKIKQCNFAELEADIESGVLVIASKDNTNTNQHQSILQILD